MAVPMDYDLPTDYGVSRSSKQSKPWVTIGNMTLDEFIEGIIEALPKIINAYYQAQWIDQGCLEVTEEEN